MSVPSPGVAPLPGAATDIDGTLRRILVDGGSGAGKTGFARRLREHWQSLCGEQVQLVSLDDCYPGWHGLAAGSRAVHETILDPHSPGYRRWDWERGRPADWVTLDASRPMVVEGCGAITRRAVALADLTLWLELDEETRKQRALTRDGEAYSPWWETWAAQERDHWRREQPWLIADLVLEVS